MMAWYACIILCNNQMHKIKKAGCFEADFFIIREIRLVHFIVNEF